MPAPTAKQGSKERIFYGILVLALSARLIYAFTNPVYNAPDEQAHFKYVQYLVQEASFPKAESRVEAPTNDWEYYQPPLYYLLSAPILLIFDSAYALRIFSVLLSLGVVFLTYWAFRSLIAAAFVAFLPTYVGLSTAITNDNLLIFLFTLFFFLILRGYRNPVGLGLLSGALALTKYPGLVALPFLAVLFLYEKRYKPLLFTLGIAFVMFSPWLVRNQQLYGDWFAMEIANKVVNTPLNSHNLNIVVHRIFDTFWMIFGIRNNQTIRLDFLPFIFFVLSVVLAKGFVQTWFDNRYPYKLLCGISLVFLFLTFQFAFKYGQPQGRFIYPVIMPLGLFIERGFGGWRLEAQPQKNREKKRR